MMRRLLFALVVLLALAPLLAHAQEPEPDAYIDIIEVSSNHVDFGMGGSALLSPAHWSYDIKEKATGTRVTLRLGYPGCIEGPEVHRRVDVRRQQYNLTPHTEYTITVYSDHRCTTALTSKTIYPMTAADRVTLVLQERQARFAAQQQSGLSYGDRDMDKECDLHANNGTPQGAWTDGTTLWVGDSFDTFVYAYILTGDSRCTRDTSKEFNLFRGSNEPLGITATGSYWYTAAAGSFDDTNRYDYPSGSNGAKLFDLTTNNQHPTGVATNGTHLFLPDWSDNLVYAYTLAGTRVQSREIDLGAGVWEGAAYNDSRLWIGSMTTDELLAWTDDGTSFTRATSLDFDNLATAGNTDPSGHTTDGVTMWVVDSSDTYVYAYSLFVLSTAAPTLSSTATTIGVSWTAPTETGGADITAYDVQYRETGATDWTIVDDAWTNGALEYTIEDLQPLTEHEVQVRAVTTSDGSWSDSAETDTEAVLGAIIPIGEASTDKGGDTLVAVPTPAAGEIDPTIDDDDNAVFAPFAFMANAAPDGVAWLAISSLVGILAAAAAKSIIGSSPFTRSGIMAASQILFALMFGGISFALLNLSVIGTLSVGLVMRSATSRGQ